ncbi:SER2-like protein [Mya arenaria]|uniref:SER2-like protein n=1 Tax=Mya arenaria TaxID=6604 RepID=A0ABY7F9P3_MYAAR|nr:SER2-like protein [Mya arenaria]
MERNKQTNAGASTANFSARRISAVNQTTFTMNGTICNGTCNTEAIKVEITFNKILVGVLLYIIVIITVIGNILVLLAIKIRKCLRTTFNYYIVNLAITDVAVAVSAMSFKATQAFYGTYWPFGEFMWMTFVSVFTLILISLDRFWSVTWIQHYRQHHSKRLLMLALWVPPWLSDRLRHSKPGECYWNPALNVEFVFIIATLGHHGPFLVLIFCYSRVYAFMKRRGVGLLKTNKVRSSSIRNINMTEKFSDTCYVNSVVPEGSQCNTGNLSAQQEQRASGMTKQASTSKDKSGIFIVEASNLLTVPSHFKHYTNITSNCERKTNESLKGDEHSEHFQSARTTSLSVDPIDQNSTQTVSRRIKHRNVKDKRVFKTLTYIVIGYVILWLPFHVVFDISIVYPGLVPEAIIETVFWMTYLNSTLNPFLYNFSCPVFKEAFYSILCVRHR